MPYGRIAYVEQLDLQSTAQMDNATVFMDLSNTVFFCGDCILTNYAEGQAFAVLPDSILFPLTDVVLPVCVTASFETETLSLDTQSSTKTIVTEVTATKTGDNVTDVETTDENISFIASASLVFESSSSAQTRTVPLKIASNGNVSLMQGFDSATVHLSGFQFTANSRYYTPEIGNVYANNTSPLL